MEMQTSNVVTVSFAGSLARLLRDVSPVALPVAGTTLRAVFERLEADRPGTQAVLFAPGGELRPYLAAVTDGVTSTDLDAAIVRDGSRVLLVSAFAGG